MDRHAELRRVGTQAETARAPDKARGALGDGTTADAAGADYRTNSTVMADGAVVVATKDVLDHVSSPAPVDGVAGDQSRDKDPEPGRGAIDSPSSFIGIDEGCLSQGQLELLVDPFNSCSQAPLSTHERGRNQHETEATIEQSDDLAVGDAQDAMQVAGYGQSLGADPVSRGSDRVGGLLRMAASNLLPAFLAAPDVDPK